MTMREYRERRDCFCAPTPMALPRNVTPSDLVRAKRPCTQTQYSNCRVGLNILFTSRPYTTIVSPVLGTIVGTNSGGGVSGDSIYLV